MKKLLSVILFLSLTVCAAEPSSSSTPFWLQELIKEPAKARHATEIQERLQQFDAGSSGWRDAMESIAANDSDTRVKSGAKTELASFYRVRGRLSRNIQHLKDVWQTSRDNSDQASKNVADHALSQLVFSLSCVGRVQELQEIFSQTSDRQFANQADYEIYRRAKEAFLVMSAHPDIAYRCGTAALYEVAKALGIDEATLRALNDEASPFGGFTLTHLLEVSHNLGMDMAAVNIGTGPIPVPSVVHWKSDHYAAIKAKEGDQYEIIDHTLSLHLYMSEEEIRDESTEDFLIQSQQKDASWHRLSKSQSDAVVGRGYPNMLNDAKDFGCKNIAASNPCQQCKGMPDWFVSEPYINLWVQDVPYFYKTSDGEFECRLSFRDRDPRLTDPLAYPYLPTGTWTHNWISYVKLTAKGSGFAFGYTAKLYTQDGGTLFFEDDKKFDPESGCFFTPLYPHVYNGHDNITTSPNLGFKLFYPDGSFAVYESPGYDTTVTSQSSMTQFVDVKGRTNQFIYGPITNALGASKRALLYTIDYDGKTNSLIYNPDFTLHQIQSPYGAAATLGYDGSGRVNSITDAVGLKSTFSYHPFSGALTNCITPYGTNSFEYYTLDGGNYAGTNNAAGHDTGGNLLINRAVRATDPKGGNHLYMFRYAMDSSLVPSSFSSSQTPQDQPEVSLPSGTQLDTGGTGYDSFAFRNSFVWNSKTDPGTLINQLSNLTATAYSTARWRHWLIENDPVVVTTSSALSFEREGAPTNSLTGAVIWYDYKDKPSKEKVGTQHRIRLKAARLEGGDTTFQHIEYTDQGLPLSFESTYRPASGLDVTSAGTTLSYELDLGTEELWYRVDPFSPVLMSSVVYTNSLLKSITIDGVQVMGAAGFGTRTNTFEIDPDAYSAYTFTNIARIPQPFYVSNALGETNQFTYGIKRRLESVLTPIGITEFNYFTNGIGIGKLESVVENSSSAMHFTYATNGTIASIQTPLGLTLTTSFDYLNRPLEIDFPAQTGSHGASSIVYSYALASGTNVTGGTNILDVTKIIDRQGYDTKFEYDSLRHVSKITDAEGRDTIFGYACSCGALDYISNSLQVVSFDYDLQSRMTGMTYPDLTHVHYDYNSFGQLKMISESATNFVALTFNNQGFLASASNQSGIAWMGGYDTLGRLTFVTNGLGYRASYDKLGRVTASAYKQSSLYVTNQTWGFAAGLFPPTSYTNALGETSFLGYDAFGRLTSVVQTNLSTNSFSYNAAGQLATFTDALGATAGWIYDSEGRLSSKTNALGATIASFYYYPNGWISNRVDATGNSVKYIYDKVGNLKTNAYASRNEVFTYDAMNRLTGMTDSAGSHAFSYLNGFLSTEDGPWASDTISYQYSHLRQSALTTQSLFGYRNISYGYDAVGRLNNVTSPAGRFGYEYLGGDFAALSGAFGRLNLPGGGLITNVFDHPVALMTRTALRSPGGGELLASGYLFDLAGQVKTNFHSDTTKTIYNYFEHGALQAAFGQATNNAALSDQNLSYKYDPAGNLIARTNAALVQTFTTNKLNQIASASATGTIIVSGAASPNATSVTVNGVSATLNADKSFYRASVPITDSVFTAVATDSATGASTSDSVANVWAAGVVPSYDAFGNLKSFGNRLFSYDEENRLKSVIVASTTGNKETDYIYDGLGRLRVKQQKSVASTPLVTAQTLGTVRSNFTGWVGCAFTVGSNPVLVTHLGRWVVSGNTNVHTVKLVKASDGSDVAGASVSLNTLGATSGQYLYGILASPVTLIPGAAYCLLSTETTNLDLWYDRDSVLTTTSAGSITSAAFSGGLPSLLLPGGANNSYGPVNLKYAGGAVTSIGETHYVYDGNLVIEERDGNNQTLVQYTRGRGINGIGGLLARTDGGTHSYYFADRGNVTGLVDGAGNLKASYSYDPFGRITESSGPLADSNHYRFSTREFDPDTGLYNFGGRFYDPTLQRFLNPDPSGENGGLNLYAFGNNSPPNYLDPTGQNPFAIAGAIIGAAVGAGSSYINGGSGSDIAISALKGAAFGALAGFTGGVYGTAAYDVLLAAEASPFIAGVGAGIVGGTVGDATSQFAELATGQRCSFSGKELGFSAALGGVLGGVAKSIPEPFLNKYLPTFFPAANTAPRVVNAQTIQAALEGSTMRTAQAEVSIPAVERYVRMLESGSTAPAIKVADGVIIEGNHRFVAGRVFGTEPPITPGTLSPSQASQVRPIQQLNLNPADFGNH